MAQERMVLKRDDKEIVIADETGGELLRTHWTLIKDIFIHSQWFTLHDGEKLEAQLQEAMAMSDEVEMVETIIAHPLLLQTLQDLITPRYPIHKELGVK